MAVFLGSALAELGAGISYVLAEAGFSSTVAGTVAGGVVSNVSSKIDETVKNALDKAARYVISEEKTNTIEQTANDVKNSYFDTAMSIWTQDPKYLLEARKQKNKENLAKAIAKNNQDNNEVDNKTEICKCDQENFMDQVINSENPGFPEIKVENKTPKAEDADSKSFSSKELADIIVSHCSEIAKSKSIDEEQIVKLISTDVNKYTLVQRLTEFYKNSNIPTDEVYQEISQVYNGRKKNGLVLSPSDVSIEYDRDYGGLSFSINDEVDQLVTLKETKGFYLPAVYGIFGGPMSRNNAPPIDSPDTFFMLHDAEYSGSGGYFNEKADMKLVSRLILNKNAWPEDKISLLNSIVIYFSTFGLSVAKLKGSLPKEVTIKPVPDLTKDDIYPVMNPESLTYTDDVYIQKRFEFYRDFEDDIKTTVTSSSSMFAESGWFTNQQLLTDFDNLEIILI